jgi:hypothetical protein
MSDATLPPCGLYRTRAPIASIPSKRLVYFHNHGNPGPGLYLPESWGGHRPRVAAPGPTQPDADAARLLEPLPAEGFYRVAAPFHCCAKECRLFEIDLLVQLGYDGAGQALLFLPELVDGLLGVPDRGTRVDDDVLPRLRALKVTVGRDAHPDAVVH